MSEELNENSEFVDITPWLCSMVCRYYSLNHESQKELIQDVNYAFQRLLGSKKHSELSSFQSRSLIREGDSFAAPVFGIMRRLYWVHFDVAPSYYIRLFSPRYEGSFWENLHRDYLIWLLCTILRSVPMHERNSASNSLLTMTTCIVAKAQA